MKPALLSDESMGVTFLLDKGHMIVFHSTAKVRPGSKGEVQTHDLAKTFLCILISMSF